MTFGLDIGDEPRLSVQKETYEMNTILVKVRCSRRTESIVIRAENCAVSVQVPVCINIFIFSHNIFSPVIITISYVALVWLI